MVLKKIFKTKHFRNPPFKTPDFQLNYYSYWIIKEGGPCSNILWGLLLRDKVTTTHKNDETVESLRITIFQFPLPHKQNNNPI